MLDRNWRSLIRPERLDVEPGQDPTRTATIIAEPLERGFGMTLGNALRRVLLSSLQGAAVTGIRIDGVLHEFSSIPGVREDVTDIVLNVKQLAIRMQVDGPKRVTLTAKGPGEVTAAQIQTTADIEVANPELVLCTLERLVRIPVPYAWHSLVVHPDAVLETRRAREALAGSYALKEFVAQSANLALGEFVVHPRQFGLCIG